MPEKPRNIPPEDQPDEITLQMREWLKNMSPEEEARITESMGKAFEVFERLMKDPITTQLPTIDGVVFTEAEIDIKADGVQEFRGSFMVPSKTNNE